MRDVAIILGSESDLGALKKSKMTEILDKVGMGWTVSILSAHRHAEALRISCEKKSREGTRVFIGAAGMSAALPGAISAILGGRSPVLGVALTSSNARHTEASESAQTCMPPGRPVLFCGYDGAGFKNAALAACQILAISDQALYDRLLKYLEQSNPEPKLDVQTSKREA